MEETQLSIVAFKHRCCEQQLNKIIHLKSIVTFFWILPDATLVFICFLFLMAPLSAHVACFASFFFFKPQGPLKDTTKTVRTEDGVRNRETVTLAGKNGRVSWMAGLFAIRTMHIYVELVCRLIVCVNCDPLTWMSRSALLRACYTVQKTTCRHNWTQFSLFLKTREGCRTCFCDAACALFARSVAR